MSNPTEQLIGELLEPRLTKGDRESALGQVSDYLRQARGMPTLASISRATRLSPGTVRNALRRLEKSRMVKRLRVKAGSKGRRAKEIGRRHIFRWREDMSKTEIEKAADQLLEQDMPTPEEGDWGDRSKATRHDVNANPEWIKIVIVQAPLEVRREARTLLGNLPRLISVGINMEAYFDRRNWADEAARRLTAAGIAWHFVEGEEAIPDAYTEPAGGEEWPDEYTP